MVSDFFRVTDFTSGGKSATDEDGSRKLITSQLETNSGVRDLMNNLRGKWPLILIMGKASFLLHFSDEGLTVLQEINVPLHPAKYHTDIVSWIGSRSLQVGRKKTCTLTL